MAQKLPNNVSTTITNNPLGSGDTTINVATGDGASFALTNGDYIDATLTQPAAPETSWEPVRIVARSSDALTVIRGIDGSTPASWVLGSKLAIRIRQRHLEKASLISDLRGLDPRQLPYLRKAINGAIVGGSRARILCIGDSNTQGIGTDNVATHAWPAQVAAALDGLRGLRVDCDSICGDSDGSTNSRHVLDPRIGTFDGSWTALYSGSNSLGGALFENTGGSGTFAYTPLKTCDTFKIWVAGLSGVTGHLGFQVDSGTTDNIDTGAIGFSGFTYSGSPLSVASHTAKLTWISDGSVFPIGIEAWNSVTGGISFIQAGWYGAASTAVNANGTAPFDPRDAAVALAADAYLVCICPGDLLAGNSLATYVSTMQSFITALKAVPADVILIAPAHANGATLQDSELAPRVAAMRGLAEDNDIPFVDIFTRNGSWILQGTMGSNQDTVAHQTQYGHYEMAQPIIELFRSLL